MNQNLFRKKSIDRVSSPEQLNEYIKVANPSIWVLLATIVILLAGVVAWSCIGHLETTLPTAVVCTGGEAVAHVKEADAQKLQVGMIVRAGSEEFTVARIADEPVPAEEAMSEYALHASGLTPGEWVYAVTISGGVADGVHKAEIVTESISPISFILN